MPHLGEERRGGATHHLERRVSPSEVRPGGLDGSQLGDEGVELGIGDLRVVVHEVTPGVVVDQAAQLLGPVRHLPGI